MESGALLLRDTIERSTWNLDLHATPEIIVTLIR